MNPLTLFIRKVKAKFRPLTHSGKFVYFWTLSQVMSRLCRLSSAQSGERHLLLICSFFPPHVTGGTYRPLSFARMAQTAGWRITVVTQSPAEATDAAERELLSRVKDIEVIRLPSVWLAPPAWLCPKIDGDLPAIYRQFPLLAKRLGQVPFSVVMASGPHFDNFVLAHMVAQGSGKPLVLDYRDEWSESPFSFVRKGPRDSQYEAAMLKAADIAIFTTQSQLERNRAVFGDGPVRVVIPNGWDEDIYPEIFSRKPPENAKFTLGFIGNFAAHNDPLAFLRMVADTIALRPDLKERLQLRLVGSVPTDVKSMIADMGLEETVLCVGTSPQSRIPEIQSQCDALLVVYSSGMERYIPGKFYDYMASGAPLLVTGRHGEVPAIVRDLHAGVVMDAPTPEAFADVLDQLMTATPEAFDTPRRHDWRKKHSRAAAALKFYAALDEFLADRY